MILSSQRFVSSAAYQCAKWNTPCNIEATWTTKRPSKSTTSFFAPFPRPNLYWNLPSGTKEIQKHSPWAPNETIIHTSMEMCIRRLVSWQRGVYPHLCSSNVAPINYNLVYHNWILYSSLWIFSTTVLYIKKKKNSIFSQTRTTLLHYWSCPLGYASFFYENIRFIYLFITQRTGLKHSESYFK